MAEMMAMLPMMGAEAAATVPSGMATAGGMASGVGTAGAVGTGAALPGSLSALGAGLMQGASPVIGGHIASALLPSAKQNFPTPRPLGASFSMMPPQLPGAGVRPVPAIGSGGGDSSGTPLAMLLKVLQGGR